MAAAASAGGGILLVAALWMPWFRRRVSGGFAGLRAETTSSGWEALGAVAAVMVVVAVVAVAWGLLAPGRRPPTAGLVIAGGLALMVEVGLTVAKVGVDDPGCCDQFTTTTLPGAGLGLAFAATAAVVLAGLVVLVGDARAGLRRSG